MKHFLSTLLSAAVLLLQVSAVHAENTVFSGTWIFGKDADGKEVLMMEDRSDGSFRLLIGTTKSCVEAGSPYQDMRDAIEEYGPQFGMLWSIENRCGELTRICIIHFEGRVCSTYLDKGWLLRTH